MSQKRLLSLPALQECLNQELDNLGPSIATLKRWAATGLLDAARHHEPAKSGHSQRVRFDLATARRLILARWSPRRDAGAPMAGQDAAKPGEGHSPSGNQALAAHASAQVAAPMVALPLADFQAMQAHIQRLGEQVQQAMGSLREIQRDASDFRVARMALMRKYDESNAMQLQLIAELKSNRGGSTDGRGGDSILELSRIAAGISRLSDRVASLEMKLDETNPPSRPR